MCWHRRWLLLLLTLLIVAHRLPLSAQQMSDSYYRENPSWLDAELWASDGEYYLGTTSLYSPFERFALYGFSSFGYSYRGESRNGLTTHLGAIRLTSPLSRYTDYSLISILRRLPAEREEYHLSSHSEYGAAHRGEIYHTSPADFVGHRRLRLQLSSRTYCSAVGYSSAWQNRRGTYYSLSAGGRWGRDAVVEGLFTQEEYVWLSGQRLKERSEGVRESLQIALMLNPTLRSQRSWNTEEVFELTGNRYYNSYWGLQSGRVRSSRLRREFLPAVYVAWNLNDDYVLSNINLSALVRGGRKSRTTLDWVDAPSPIPDYYGYLPSYCDDPQAALLVEDVWRRGEERYTQIDWQSLYRTNMLWATEGARYALFEERSDMLSLELDGSAALLGEEGGRVGVRVSLHDDREYNVASDLMGGERLAEGYDLYDYSVEYGSGVVYASLRTVEDWGNLSASLEAGATSIGYRSRTTQRSGDDTYALLAARAMWNSRPEEWLRVGATAYYNRSAPYWGDRYGASEGKMMPNRWAGAESNLGGECRAEVELYGATIYVTLYSHLTTGGSRVEHFWNDVRDEYSALMVGRLRSLRSGVELSVRVPLSPQLRAEGHFSMADYRYIDDAVASLVAFDTGEVVAEEADVYLDGVISSSSPRLLGAVKLNYFTPSGWMLGLECAAAARRVVEPSLWLHSSILPLERMTAEEREALLDMKSLGGGYNLSLFAYRRIGNLSLSLSVRNLLGSRNIYYDGYQPSRLYIRDVEYALSYAPHAPRLQYVYPLHAYLTVSYDF